ncbi:hypothetical protein [Nodularia sp. NIES-3585]|uniref:hypothetical protein n=1 Tax=Nodularia sp. NIES-3585 TaxID=1973477 RepID=UPI000B5C4620|nr:hypothetical protein [Nodularia sp. NIES-3585]GAX38808.1 hypothetical protein NIES3585_48600 [Nodularia sp. NIES-3585]
MSLRIIYFAFSGGNLLTKASETAAEIADGFNELWDNTLSGDLYNSLCTVGVLFAVATFVFFMIQWTKQMVNSEEQRAVTDFIWVLIVVALLANNGQLLGQGTLAIRNYINNTNNFVLEYTAQGANLSEAFKKALENEAARSAIGAEIENCRSSSLTPEDAISCLEDARNRLSTEYPSYFSGTGPLASTIQRLQTIVQAPIDAINSGANPLQVIFSPFSAVIGNNIREQITYILLGLNGAYQWGLELTMLVTALIGPLAVGGSLLPYGAKSIFAWLTGYFSVGMAKLSFNIIVGFAAQLMVTSRADQPLFFLFVIAIIAPFLATGLAAGAGLAVLQQVNKAAEFYGSMAINFGSMAITKGAGLASQKIKPGG